MYIITLPEESHLLFAEFDKIVYFRACLGKLTWLDIDQCAVFATVVGTKSNCFFINKSS